MISFIDEHRSVFGVEPIPRLLPIAPSTYYDNVAKRLDVDRLSVRARSDIALEIEIRRVFEANFRVYGVRPAHAVDGTSALSQAATDVVTSGKFKVLQRARANMVLPTPGGPVRSAQGMSSSHVSSFFSHRGKSDLRSSAHS